jgi:S-adenosyl-L-methionine hydrolase (adenosine-forming)
MLTLLTDFGLQDAYVGVLKGMIAQIDSTIQVIDLTHQIPPQNITQARFVLMTAVPYFPAGTVHVAIVDPGVGSARRAIAVAIGDDWAKPAAFLVGPDNGIVSGVTSQYPILGAISLTTPCFWRTTTPSFTFHGRDIFAPVGAHLAGGVPFGELGTAIDPATLVALDLPMPMRVGNQIQGCIQAIDQFGNLITNISAADVGENWTIQLGTRLIASCKTYRDRPVGELVALIGSHGWVEIAINSGNAAHAFDIIVGDEVWLH